MCASRSQGVTSLGSPRRIIGARRFSRRVAALAGGFLLPCLVPRVVVAIVLAALSAAFLCVPGRLGPKHRQIATAAWVRRRHQSPPLLVAGWAPASPVA